ncbi:MAG: 3-isopropylmalate dehydratase small subunit [Nitriliruptorales bacterium]|nr:3-isopropylmalate dehydratase small subunit [Nitriliruptorales bacterium]
MNPVQVIDGTMMPLDRADVDTDQIMPKQFLKRIERTGFGEFCFHDWRAEPDFVLNDPRRSDARVLVTGPNFGSGSSREHAPWGLQQWGFEAIVAPSFADIFKTNCAKIGLLTVVVPPEICKRLIAQAQDDPRARCRIDLAAQRVVAGDIEVGFDIDEHTKRMLLEGLDDIALTLRHAEQISRFEQRRPRHLPITASA